MKTWINTVFFCIILIWRSEQKPYYQLSESFINYTSNFVTWTFGFHMTWSFLDVSAGQSSCQNLPRFLIHFRKSGGFFLVWRVDEFQHFGRINFNVTDENKHRICTQSNSFVNVCYRLPALALWMRCTYLKHSCEQRINDTKYHTYKISYAIVYQLEKHVIWLDRPRPLTDRPGSLYSIRGEDKEGG